MLVVRGHDLDERDTQRQNRIGFSVPTTRVLSSGVGELQLLVAEDVAVDVALQVGVDRPVDGERGVLAR